VGDGANIFFWHDPWLGGVPLRVWFSHLFELADDKSLTVSLMLTLGGRRVGRRGGGRDGCGFGRRCYGSVSYYYVVFLCSLMLQIPGGGSLIHLKVTHSVAYNFLAAQVTLMVDQREDIV